MCGCSGRDDGGCCVSCGSCGGVETFVEAVVVRVGMCTLETKYDD